MGPIVTMVVASQPGEGFTTSRWLAGVGATGMLDHVLTEARSWPAEPGLVVLGADAEEVLNAVDFTGFSVLIDPEWEEGEVASLRAGLDFLGRDPEIGAVLLVSAEMPIIPPGVVPDIIAAHQAGERPATVPKYRYAHGRPVVIGRELWPSLLGIEKGTTLEGVLATHTRWVTEVWIDHLPPTIMASPADLQKLAHPR